MLLNVRNINIYQVENRGMPCRVNRRQGIPLFFVLSKKQGESEEVIVWVKTHGFITNLWATAPRTALVTTAFTKPRTVVCRRSVAVPRKKPRL